VYVCVCNAYRESHVRDAIQHSREDGVPTVAQVYARLGRAPRCGRCLLYVEDLINRTREKQPQSDVS
jgi:bacterioferritin-associated ferredoxin